MTLVQLRHLIELARTGSFSKAAEVLCITQPALSRSVRALESELGAKLLDRIGRRSYLTPFGEHVLSDARRVVLDAEELRQRAPRFFQGRESRLRIGLGSGPGAMLRTPLLMQAATRRPPLQVEIVGGGIDLLVHRLRERSLDAVVVDIRSLQPSTDLDVHLLPDMRATFLCRKGHPLARRRKALHFDELIDYPVASTPLSGEAALMLLNAYGARAHPDRLVTLRCEDIPSLIGVVRTTDAILLAVRATAPDLVELRTDPPLYAVARFGVVTLAGRTEAPGLVHLRELIEVLMRN